MKTTFYIETAFTSLYKGEGKPAKSDDKVSMPKDEFVAEHKKLLHVLETPSRKDDRKEHAEQKKELEEVQKGDPNQMTREELRAWWSAEGAARFNAVARSNYEALVQGGFIKKGEDGEVASVAVVEGTKVLMGRRRDNGRWTLPGGHLEAGEDPSEGARRELKEEAGIEATQLDHLGSERVTTRLGKDLTIHAYRSEHNGDKPSSKEDPDHEVAKWEWIEMKDGLPEHVANNLHSPKNTVLKLMGLLSKSFAELFQLPPQPQPQPQPGSGLGDRTLFFVTDLLKSGARSHKYIRKYQRGGRWIYVYHEGEQRGRQIPEEAVHHIRAMAEAGDEDAKALHESIQPHEEEKLKLLRKLADAGDQDAHKHLKHFGIDRDKEKLEEQLIPAAVRNQPADPVDAELAPEKQRQAVDVIRRQVQTFVYGHLASHGTSPYSTSLSNRGVTLDSIMGAVKEKKTVRTMLEELHKQLKKMDEAHAGLPQSQNEAARREGGYGNLAYNKAVVGLQNVGVVPAGYSDVHRRETGKDPEIIPFGKLQRRQEQEKREREERERRELGEIHGSLAHHMLSMLENPSSMDIDKVKKLHRALKGLFGKDMKKEDWPYNFESAGYKTKIKNVSLSNGGTQVMLDMQVYDKDGNAIMDGWTRYWTKGSDGRPRIENAYMGIKESARGGAQVGNLINAGQRNLMRSIPGGGTIHVHANIDVGGYNWSNQGFSWDDRRTLSNFRQRFQLFARENGINLSDDDMMHFKEPCHFSSFSDGGKYIIQNSRGTKLPLSQLQIETKSLTGVAGQHPLSEEELRSKKSDRQAVHLGKKFMLRTDWYGTWDSARDTEASKFADQYLQLKDRAVEHLSNEYQGIVKRAKEGRAQYVVSRDQPAQPITPRSSVQTGSGHERVDRYIRYWAPTGISASGSARRIRMTASRMDRIMGWPRAEVEAFIQHAPITYDARQAIRNRLRERTW